MERESKCCKVVHSHSLTGRVTEHWPPWKSKLHYLLPLSPFLFLNMVFVIWYGIRYNHCQFELAKASSSIAKMSLLHQNPAVSDLWSSANGCRIYVIEAPCAKEKCRAINGQTTYAWGWLKCLFYGFIFHRIVRSYIFELFNLKQCLRAKILGPKTSVSVCVYSPASIYILPLSS